GAGLVLGGALSAVQWIPGLGFITTSQRGAVHSVLFGDGSLSLPHIASLLLVPFLLGGNTNFHLIVYQGSYNLQELTIGVGLVAVAAALAYLPSLLESFVTWARRMLRPSTSDLGSGFGLAPGRQPGARPLLVWYVVGAVGVLLTLGTDTSLGSALAKIPLYGGERLQNRNAALIDLALVVILAFFVDDLVGRSRSLVEAWRPLCGCGSRLLAALGPLAAIILIVLAFGAPLAVERRLEMPVADEARLFDQLGPYLDATIILAALLVVFLLVAATLPVSLRRAMLVVFVLADVLTYALNASYAAPQVGNYNSHSAATKTVAALTGANGRDAMFDPLSSFPPTGMWEPNYVGVNDLNLLQGVASVEGYGSVVDGTYEDATETHGVEYLAVDQLSGDLFDVLDLHALFTLPHYIWDPLPRHAVAPVAGLAPVKGTWPAPENASGPYRIAPGQSETFVMAAPSALVRATAILDPQPGGDPASLRIAEGDRITTATLPDPVRAQGSLQVAVAGFPSNVVVDSVDVQNDSDVTAVVGAVVIVTRRPALRYVLDGELQGSLYPPHWRYAGTVRTPKGDNFSAFVNTRTRGLAWLQPPDGGQPNTALHVRGASLRVLQEPDIAPETMLVDTPVAATLVRSEAYAPGWSATIDPLGGGPARTEPAEKLALDLSNGNDLLVQMVHVPPGRYRITWHYAPRSLREGELLTLLGTIALLAIGASALVEWRRRNRGRQRLEPLADA
ncbi:MAG TPA: hypothetical protein VMD59_22205, partial [Acidimicrobiales bacterium]|nr:hypothetical protein [Acidimicrobiales bacterium]